MPLFGSASGISLATVLAALYPTPHTVSAAGATQVLTFDIGARETVWDVTMAANTSFTIDTTNMVVGSSMKLILRQDATAGRTPTLPPKAAWPNGSVPTANTVSGKHDVFFFDSDDGIGIDGSARTLGALTPAVSAAPSIAVAAGNGQNVITVTDGAANGSAITSHKMYRAPTAGAEVLVGTVTLAGGGTYTDTGLTNGQTYYYKFTAVNGVGESAQSTEASGAPAVPAAPTATNYVQKSSLLTNTTAWPVKGSRGTGASTTIDPQGGTGAFELYVPNSNSGLEQAITGLTAGADYILSFYAKTNSTAASIVVYGKTTVTFTTTAAWQRFSVLITATSSGGLTFNLETTGSVNWDAFIYGPQIEVDNTNHTPTTYNPTS